MKHVCTYAYTIFKSADRQTDKHTKQIDRMDRQTNLYLLIILVSAKKEEDTKTMACAENLVLPNGKKNP